MAKGSVSEITRIVAHQGMFWLLGCFDQSEILFYCVQRFSALGPRFGFSAETLVLKVECFFVVEIVNLSSFIESWSYRFQLAISWSLLNQGLLVLEPVLI